MNNSIINTLLYLFLIPLIFSCSNQQESLETTERPNILFIMSDDHAYQAISAYGSPIN